MIGRHDIDTYYAFGPYHLNYTLEVVVLLSAALTWVVSVWLLIRDRHRPPGTGLSGKSVVLLLLFGSFCAWSWRVMTAGVSGANIAGILLAVTGPVIAAGLLVGAIRQQHQHRPISGRLLAVLITAVIALAAAAIMILYSVAGD